MGLSFSLCQNLEQKQEFKLTLSQSFGEKSGDIPLFSLHRFKNLLRKNPIGISKELTGILARELLKQNAKYKIDSGNDWSCITGLNFTDAVESVDVVISAHIEAAKNVPNESKLLLIPIFKKLRMERQISIKNIKTWFENNYDGLLYLRDKKIPWAVIQRLRKNLAVWTINSHNPFKEDIREMVTSVAEEQGIVTSSAEDAWVKMGGKIFTKKEE